MAQHISGPLYYEQQGASGVPMLFLHSTPDDHRLWMFQTTHLAEFGEAITSPALLIGGSPDRNHPNAPELARRIKGCEYKVIEGAGHTSNLESPWEFGAYCIEFLKKHGLFPG